MANFYLWRDQSGMQHKIPGGSCVICEHCTDIFLDPFRGNEILKKHHEKKEDKEK